MFVGLLVMTHSVKAETTVAPTSVSTETIQSLDAKIEAMQHSSLIVDSALAGQTDKVRRSVILLERIIIGILAWIFIELCVVLYFFINIRKNN